MENKYYTPTIDEIYVGFELEENLLDEGWNKVIFSLNSVDYSLLLNGNLDYYRVKYLDKEDIESLGWVYRHSEENSPCICYNKDNIDIIFNPRNNWVLITKGDSQTDWLNWKTIYAGNIKNKSELKKLLKQLGITNE